MTPEEIQFQRSRRLQAQQRTVLWLRSEIERLKEAQTDYAKGKRKALTSALRMLDVDGAWIANINPANE